MKRSKTARTLSALTLTGALLVATAPLASAAGPNNTFAIGAQRLSGPDRIATAISASRATFPASTDAAGVVVLASAANYADAIGGGTLAAAAYAPLLLSEPGSLRNDVGDEVERVTANSRSGGTALVLGGSKSISQDVTDALQARGIRVQRIAGADRYETAAKVAALVAGYSGGLDGSPIYLASGTDFPDGLAVAPLAAHRGGVVLLTNGSAKVPATTAYLAANDPSGARTVAVGGPADRAYPTTSTDPAGHRIVGFDRYLTATAVASQFRNDVGAVGLATGTDWPDALAAGAVLGQTGGGPLLLSDGRGLGVASSELDALRSQEAGLTVGLVFGGPKAVPEDIYRQFAARFTSRP